MSTWRTSRTSCPDLAGGRGGVGYILSLSYLGGGDMVHPVLVLPGGNGVGRSYPDPREELG